MNNGYALNCSHATWTVKNAEDEGEGEGEEEEEEEEQWLAVETVKANGDLLSTIDMQHEQ